MFIFLLLFSKIFAKVDSMTATKTSLSAKLQDISDQLREREILFINRYDAISVGIVVQNIHGEIVYANKASAEILGLPIHEMRGLTSKDSIWGAVGSDLSPLPFEEHPIVRTLRTGQSVRDFVHGIFNRQTNELRWLLVNSEPVFHPATKEFVEAVATFVDITDRKLAEESARQETAERELVEQALRASRTRYQLLFENMLDAFAYHQIIKNDSGLPIDYVFLEINAAFEKTMGLNRSQVIGKRATELFPTIATSPFDLIGTFGKTAASGLESRFEYHLDGFNRWFSVAAFSPQPGYFVTLFEDITERKGVETKRRLEREYLISLNEIALGLMNRLNLDELFFAIVTRASALFDNCSGSLYLPCEDGLNVEIKVVGGLPAKKPGLIQPKNQGLIHEVFSSGKTVILEDYQQWEHRLDSAEFKATRAIVGLPLFSEGIVQGVLQVEFHQPDRHFTAEETELLNRFAQLASIAFDNATLYNRSLSEIRDRKIVEDQLKYIGLHDALTHLYNRGYFEEEMRRLDSRRSGIVGLIMCDVDGLKLINDTLGHAAGDALLIAAADVLRQSFRESDVIARIGGDEYAILMPNTSHDAIEKGVQRIRDGITRLNEKSDKVLLSLSSGWAASSSPKESMSSLYKEADTNMYREKLQQSQNTRSAMVRTLIQAMEARDYLTEGHADRLQHLTTELAKALSLPDNKLSELRLLAKFHDLGKVGIPDEILGKETDLTDAELGEIRRHPEIGYRIAQSAPDLIPIADYILKHHEWWNGHGYPFGLTGSTIPLECRILSIVDAFDAMTSNRPYRKLIGVEDACAELRRCAGTQFDPDFVELFIALQLKKG